MQKINLSGLLLICCIVRSYAQIEFEKGYFVDTNNQKTECLIKNSSWKNNPTEFSYKLSENSTTLVAKVSEVAEFGIENSMKYLGVDVQIDRSGNELSKLNFNRNPQWENERLFLNVLQEGKATLLIYNDANLQRFFIKKENIIRQLVYKQYMSESNETRPNNAFRQQLWTDVKCGNLDQNSLKEIEYKSSDLIKYFKSFNECSGSDYINYTNQGNRDAFNIKIRSGINYGTMSILDFYNYSGKAEIIDFKSKSDFRIGVEFEYVLAYNRNKWSLIVEPNFQSYKSTVNFNGTTLRANYNSMEIATGIRYYLFLNQHSSVFINGLIGPSFPINSKIYLNDNDNYKVRPSVGLNIGLGYNFKRVSAEFRYYKNKDHLDNLAWVAQRTSVIIGFKIL